MPGLAGSRQFPGRESESRAEGPKSGPVPLESGGHEAAPEGRAGRGSPARSRFQAVVSALVYSIIRERCRGLEGDPRFRPNRVVRFVLEQHARMPDYLRLPLIGLTLAFDTAALLRGGARFQRLDHLRRWRHIRAWKRSRIGLRRDLMRFYEGLTVFGAYAEADDSAAR
jgi:hypothetical protein